jgi:hypothetical protein
MSLEELRRDIAECEALTQLTADLSIDGMQAFVVLHAVPLPPGAYRVATTDVLFLTDLQYPLSAMDMFWTELDVVRTDGSVPRNAEVTENYLGRQWRRFSWHRNGLWNPVRNGVLDHFEFMCSRFADDRAPA